MPEGKVREKVFDFGRAVRAVFCVRETTANVPTSCVEFLTGGTALFLHAAIGH